MSQRAGPAADAVGVAASDVTRKILPERYVLRERGGQRVLTCLEAPNVSVTVQRGAAVSAAAARRAEPGTIYLDGAAAAEPFLDAARRVYNLDHHEGCVRAFTLATCEQAMVLVRKGLDLKGDSWTVVANEPDLDTVLALWVLLNHMRLNEPSGAVRRAVLPLLRLEGAIDVHGLEHKDLAGLPEEVEREALRWMEHVRREEVALKREGRWSDTDPLELTARTLRAVDELVYSPRDFAEVPDVEELLRVPLTEERSAILCRSEAGIYEVEAHLRRLHDSRIGLIVLQTGSGTFTLRQTDPFLAADLQAAYHRLNMMDPMVTGAGSGNQWGGSGDIGGSPRASGSGLEPPEVLRLAAEAYRPVSGARRLAAVLAASLAAVAGVALPLAAVQRDLLHPVLALPALGPVRGGLFGVLMLAAAAGLLAALARRTPRRFGATLPEGWGWLLLLPPALLGVWAGGGFMPLPGHEAPVGWLLLALAAPLASELLFRGVVPGLMATSFPARRRWLPPSLPAAVSALLFAAATALVMRPGSGLLGIVAGFLGALVLGLAAGVARERSGSVVAPAALHLGSVLLVIALQAL